MRLEEVDISLQSLNSNIIDVEPRVSNSHDIAKLAETRITKIYNSTEHNNQVSSWYHGYKHSQSCCDRSGG